MPHSTTLRDLAIEIAKENPTFPGARKRANNFPLEPDPSKGHRCPNCWVVDERTSFLTNDHPADYEGDDDLLTCKQCGLDLAMTKAEGSWSLRGWNPNWQPKDLNLLGL